MTNLLKERKPTSTARNPSGWDPRAVYGLSFSVSPNLDPAAKQTLWGEQVPLQGVENLFPFTQTCWDQSAFLISVGSLLYFPSRSSWYGSTDPGLKSTQEENQDSPCPVFIAPPRCERRRKHTLVCPLRCFLPRKPRHQTGGGSCGRPGGVIQ